MDWSDIERGDPLEMPALSSFLERNAPGSTRRMRGATEERIASLASPLRGGASALPRVYLEYLRMMGERRSPMKLGWALPEVSALLAARKRIQKSTAPARYFKYAYGMTVNGERKDDQFLDLGRPIGGGVDAHVVRGTDRELAEGRPVGEAYESFSDQLRFSAVSVVERFLGHYELEAFQPERVRDMFDALRNMGFEVTELGGCASRVPMVAPGKGMVALLATVQSANTSPHVTVAARDEKQLMRTAEILKDLRVNPTIHLRQRRSCDQPRVWHLPILSSCVSALCMPT
ncbi:MAG: hypothetical protein JWN04_3042 [Myxococcaceae bacterium]|nr:hypothetical protein [Myxococcaceae bacterium]